MPKIGYCRICKFFEKPYRQSEKENFEKLVREGVSLRRLEVFFAALSLRVRKDAIASHIHNCMGIEVKEQRELEKDGQREGLQRIGKTLREFFLPLKANPEASECLHLNTIPFFDMQTEEVYERCQSCGKVLTGSKDPHSTPRTEKKDLLILESLRKR
jgi:hypothetical protein